MQTTAISTAVKTSSTSSSASKSANDNSGQPFADMLSREIDRSTAAPDTPKNAASTAPRNSGNTAQASTNADSDKTSAQSAAEPNSSPDSTATAASGAGKTQDTTSLQSKGKTADDKQDDDANSTALSPESNELIALVTNMQQAPAVAKDAKPDVATATDSASGGKDDSTQPLAVTGTDAAALAAAQAAMAAQSTATTDSTSSPGTTASSNSNADPWAATGSNSLPTQPSITTPVQRGITMAATPAGSELKASVAAKGKHAASSAAEVDANASQDDRKTAVEHTTGDMPAAQQSAQATHAEGFVVPHAQTQSSTPHEQQQENPGIANLANAAAAMTNQSATALNQVQNVASQLAENLAPRVGTQEWNQALGQKVVWMANGEQQSASLTLNPPDLGPLQVVLSVTNNHATANFTAAQPEVRQALESAMPKLREMLGDVGIQLGQANVSAGMPNQQQNSFNAPSQQSSRHSSGTQSGSDNTNAQVRVGRVQPARSGVGLVDTFA